MPEFPELSSTSPAPAVVPVPAAERLPDLRPEPELGEVVEVCEWLESHAAHLRKMQEIGALPETELQEMLDRAATLLQQQAAPAPAVVAPEGRNN